MKVDLENLDRVLRECGGSLTHGLSGARVLAPDELMMAREECDLGGADEVDRLDVVDGDGEVDPILRQESFNGLMGALFRERRGPSALGYGVMSVAWQCAPGMLPPGLTKKRGHAKEHAAMKDNWVRLGAWDRQTVMMVVLFLLRPWLGKKQVDAVRLGKRTMVFAHLTVRAEVVRRVIPTFEAMGWLWGLTADNKRSAPQAMSDTVREELEQYYLRTGGRREDVALPGGKSAVAKERCRESALGNTNRVTGMARKKTQDLKTQDTRRNG
jgi:hypothetical protein